MLHLKKVLYNKMYFIQNTKIHYRLLCKFLSLGYILRVVIMCISGTDLNRYIHISISLSKLIGNICCPFWILEACSYGKTVTYHFYPIQPRIREYLPRSCMKSIRVRDRLSCITQRCDFSVFRGSAVYVFNFIIFFKLARDFRRILLNSLVIFLLSFLTCL